MKFSFLCLLLFCSSASVAQTSLVEKLHSMQTRPILKEKVYVHTNKITYSPDDVIWFKAYVGDSLNYPSVETRKLGVHLIDRNGTIIFDRYIHIGEGVGSGQFELDSSVAPGTYYIQAQTNYMRNFGEDYRYLQKIKILGPDPPLNKHEPVSYDIQFLPEGGHLIEGIDNNIGIKATKSGQSIDFKGTLFNELDEVITTFQSEHNGMGSFTLHYVKNKLYRAKLQLQDTILEIALPRAAPKGIALQVDNTDAANLRVYLKTNEATFYNQIYSNYSILFHQDRQLIDLVSIARLDSLTGLIEKRKERFLEGVNTVTLFADDQPIAERRFYIETDRQKVAVALKKSIENNDSTTYHLSLSAREPPSNANLSISVVTEPSLFLNQENTIESAFLLKPYVRGRIEKPAYYFDPKNPNRKSHLDLLLRTQGWTKYNLNEWIQSINPAVEYGFEKGFELRGTLNEDFKHNTLVLIPNNLRIRDKFKLKGKSDFVFKNLEVFKGDTVRVAYQNWLGKITAPKKVTFDTLSFKTRDKPIAPGLPIQKQLAPFPQEYGKDPSEEQFNSNTLPNTNGTIALDEVVVSERKRNESYLRRRNLIKRYRSLVQDIGRYREVPIQEVVRNHDYTLISFLEANQIRLNDTEPSNSYLEDSSSQKVLLVIDDQLVYPNELASISLSMKNVAHVMYTEGILIDGVRYYDPVYRIFTTDEYRNGALLYEKYIIKNGYDRPKKYYTPVHNFGASRPSHMLEVDWKPCLKTNSSGEVVFKIENQPTNSKIVLSIQGFSGEGHLISKTIRTD